MIPIVASLLGTLAQNGLGLLSSAIQAKGKEVVEQTLGVKISDNPSPEEVSKLRQLQFDHEERLLELGIEKARVEQEELKILLAAQANQENNISDRWKADMSSDSWLSKNIRPMALIAIFVAFFLFTMMSAFGYNAQESYVNLLGQWGQIIFLAYFGGRTVEKLADMRSKK
jgi:ATP-dependent Zn protease